MGLIWLRIGTGGGLVNERMSVVSFLLGKSAASVYADVSELSIGSIF